MINATRDKIEKLALQDATIHACLNAHRYGKGITYEMALAAMVCYLAEEKRALVAAELDRNLRSNRNLKIVVIVGKAGERREVVEVPGGTVTLRHDEQIARYEDLP